jgi:predicted DsbA family dithiol-disulfide isomerase
MMEPLRVRVYYDFASTLCYVGYRVMQRMRSELEALALELEWAPLDLSSLTGWPRGVEVTGPRRDNALRVARDLAVEVRMPGSWMDSRRAHAVVLALEEEPRRAAWRERVLSGVYEEGRALDEPGVLEGWARHLAIDLEPLDLDAAAARLEAHTHEARESEVTGVPTFMLGRWPFGGIQEEATMRHLLGRWAAKQRGGRAEEPNA